MSNDTQVRQQDINAIHNLFYEYHYADDLGVIKSKLAEYVATARQEAKEAAFKDMITKAKAESPPQNAGNEFARGFARAKKTILGQLETAATEKK